MDDARKEKARANIEAILAKTVEAGAEPGEEKVSVLKAFGMVGNYGFDAHEFTWPARYAVTSDGFVVPVAEVKAGTSRPPGRVRALCEELILKGMKADDIVAEVKRQMPDRNTTKGCVAWYKSKMVSKGILPKGGVAPQPAAEAEAGAEA